MRILYEARSIRHTKQKNKKQNTKRIQKQQNIKRNNNNNNIFKANNLQRGTFRSKRKIEDQAEEEAAAKGPSNGFMTTTITHEQS